MRANVKLVLMLSIPVAGKTLAEAAAAASDLKVSALVKFKPEVEHSDGSIIVTSVDTGEWIE